ncbi:MAG: hypothetical protein JXR63_06320 [Spirochaetales bacterium]|nr:hypothetical protein [Spirochaetales bacterium]
MYKLLSNISNNNFLFFHEKRITTNRNLNGVAVNLPTHEMIDQLTNNDLISLETLQITELPRTKIEKIPLLKITLFLINYSNYNNGIIKGNSDLYFQLKKISLVREIDIENIDENYLNATINALLRCEELFLDFKEKYVVSDTLLRLLNEGSLNKILEFSISALCKEIIKESNEVFIESIVIFFMNFLIFRISQYSREFLLLDQISDLLYAFPIHEICDEDTNFYEKFLRDFIKIYKKYILQLTNLIGLTTQTKIESASTEIKINEEVKSLMRWNSRLVCNPRFTA